MRRDLCSYLEDILRATEDISLCVGGVGFETFASVDTVFSTVAFKFVISAKPCARSRCNFPRS